MRCQPQCPCGQHALVQVWPPAAAHAHSAQVSPAQLHTCVNTLHRCTHCTSEHLCEHAAQVHTLHSCTCTCTSPLLPFWYQGRNQGQGTLAVLLGIVSGQHENLSKVRLQTSSAEGQELVALWPHCLSGCQNLHYPLCSVPHFARTLCWLLCPIPISTGPCPHPMPPKPQGTPMGTDLWGQAGGSCCAGTPRCTPSTSQRHYP